MPTTHYSVDDSLLLINTYNDLGQGSAHGTETWVLAPIFYDAEPGFASDDRIVDDDITTGKGIPLQNDLNWGNYNASISIWPNPAVLHHLFTWMSQDIPAGGPPETHTYPVGPLTGVGLANSRTIIYYNGESAIKVQAIMNSLTIEAAQTGKMRVTLDLRLLSYGSTALPTIPSLVGGESLWRKHITNTLFGGAQAETFSLTIGRNTFSVPPGFGSASLEAAQFDFDGRWYGSYSEEGYTPGYDAIAQMAADATVDVSGGITFANATNSCTLNLGDAKISDSGETIVRGQRGYRLEAQLIGNSSEQFFSIPALA